MGKCLVTRLKEVVNNSELPRLGQIDFYVKTASSDPNKVYIRFNSTDAVHVESEIEVYIGEVSKGTSFDLDAGAWSLRLLNGTGKVSISPKYGINGFVFGQNVQLVNIGNLAYCSYPFTVSTYKTVVEGWFRDGSLDDLASIEDYSIIFNPEGAFVRLSESGHEVSGNIENLKKFAPNAEHNGIYLSLGSSNITGTTSVFRTLSDTWKNKLTGISTNDANRGKITGNVEDFADYTNMTDFEINYINCTGNLAISLGHMTNLVNITIQGHTGAEDLKTLFDALHSNGKTSGSIVCWMGENKTLNGGTWVNGSTVTFTANGWSVSTPQ